MNSPIRYTHRIKIARSCCNRELAEMKRVRVDYPWRDIEQALCRSGERLALVGYGSLLNPDSARRTIPDTPVHGHEPVIAFGARRVFNYVMPSGLVEKYGVKIDPKERAALNVDWAGDSEAVLTGRLLDVPIADLPALRERERGYHLGPVVFVPWNEPTAAPRRGYVLVADESPVDGVVHVDNSLLPHPAYTALCRAGARLVDAEFEHAFLATSWLASSNMTLGHYLGDTE